MSLRRSSRPAHRRNAFTLMEILLALAILVILAGTGGYAIIQIQKQAKIDATKAQLSSFKGVLDNFHLQLGVFPAALQDLRTRPANMPNWNGPYLDMDAFNDPWGRPYHYQTDAAGDTYELFSAGPDGVEGTADDIPVPQ